jgi:hypothetical protein
MNNFRGSSYRNVEALIQPAIEAFAVTSEGYITQRINNVVEVVRCAEARPSDKSPAPSVCQPITAKHDVAHEKQLHIWTKRVWNRANGLGDAASRNDLSRGRAIENLKGANQFDAANPRHPAQTLCSLLTTHVLASRSGPIAGRKRTGG